ncbi:hypothetical protein OG723_44365 (plasmid) [Streptomyces sp. NBC_01278]|uniref:hypothetical protein n=1 Tax=Streptomyces sp. NBC_01278 TaxID=2903809 RepID=UPI002E3199FB|nr:hypothetical protein [Streptomyces sp. NBC_01278]
MSRTTRLRTIARHLTSGGLTDLKLTEAEQNEGRPGRHTSDGFALRQHHDEAGDLVVIAGAYGPDWFATMREIRHRLEQPYVKCTVLSEAPGLDDHELLVRWATSAELQSRKRAQVQARAPLVALLRQQEAAAKAAADRQALEEAGQSGLW